ncbi:MAG TPA: cytochrome c [Candidatus Acidoferrales bacterium]|nr:cytochrome c [Candidatus Acidoferrales bacterium]
MERSRIARIAALALIVMLASCAKSSESSSATGSPSAPGGASTPAAIAQNGVEANDGEKVYAQECSSCHQSNGEGVKGMFPPLDENPAVTGDPTVLVRIVKYGLSGKVTVGGSDYNGMMPAWGQQLTNADIASVVTYIRSAWNNKASAVTEAAVSAVSQ